MGTDAGTGCPGLTRTTLQLTRLQLTTEAGPLLP